MPVRKFRSVEEMNTVVWRRPGDPDLARVLASVWSFGRRLRPSPIQPGLRKFKSIEAMKSR